MLIRRKQLEGIRAGEITLASRSWKHPTVKAGGSLQTAVGQLSVDAVELVKRITKAEARAAGFDSPQELRAELVEGADRHFH